MYIHFNNRYSMKLTCFMPRNFLWSYATFRQSRFNILNVSFLIMHNTTLLFYRMIRIWIRNYANVQLCTYVPKDLRNCTELSVEAEKIFWNNHYLFWTLYCFRGSLFLINLFQKIFFVNFSSETKSFVSFKMNCIWRCYS